MAEWDEYVDALQTLAGLATSESHARAEVDQRSAAILEAARLKRSGQLDEHHQLATQCDGLELPLAALLRDAGTTPAPAPPLPAASLADIRHGIREIDSWLQEAGPTLASLQRTRARLASRPTEPPPRPVPTPRAPSRRGWILGISLVVVVILVIAVLVLTHTI